MASTTMDSPVPEPHAELSAEHHPRLQHHFDSLEQQKESSTLGMWLFLVTEVMFFGGLFTAYVVYRTAFPRVFAAASHSLDPVLGGINTAVLICSSLTMALAIWSAQLDKRKLIVVFLLLTIALGAVFLGVKTFEYREKFQHHLVPGPHFAPDAEHYPHLQGAARQQSQIFFALYFIMTGMHALHMIIGMCILGVLARLSWKGRFDSSYYNPLECTGLYWHFVDIVWIFLFPLLYLIGAHAR